MEGTDFVAPMKDYETAFDAFETALNNFYQVDEYELIVPFGHRACCHIIHYFKRNWWQSVNECEVGRIVPAQVFGR
jgi:hypothetical protein